MSKEITPRQQELLNYLQGVVESEHRFPSYREMAQAMGVSAVGTIQDHIQALVEAGFVEKDGRKLKLISTRQTPSMSVPIVGEVAAGALQDAYEIALGSIAVSPEMLAGEVKANDLFALRVKGLSMIDAAIMPGDLLIVNKNARVRTGDIVVADWQGEATVKELELPKEKGAPIRLIPKNESMKPIELEPDERFRILGKVISIQRFL